MTDIEKEANFTQESPRSAISGLNLQFLQQDIDDQSSTASGSVSIQNTELLTMATQTVVSFVFVNKQPSLFNLLIQMLTTNKFTPIPLGQNLENSNIPFKPSPTPLMPNSNNNNNGSTSSLSPNEKAAMMFNILDQAINAISQQYKKNFYTHILEKPTELSPTHDQLVAGCLSFINHMLHCAPTFFDFERYRQVLSAQGVNEIIKKYVKSVDPNVRCELLHYQKHKISGYRIAKQTSIITDHTNIVSFANRLCKMSFDQDFSSSIEDKLKRLGFESPDPTEELMGTGVLGLKNMIYFCARYSRIYKEILEAQLNKNGEQPFYSFSRVGFTLTNLLFELYIEDENLYEIIFDQDDWFEELFCISFELFDEIWEREARSIEDYITIVHKTRAILSRLKWTNPDSIKSFQVTLGNVLDEMWSKIQDQKEEMEMTARVGGLSDSIIGLPPQNAAGSSQNRFQKFIGEKFKNRKSDAINPSSVSEQGENGLNNSSGSVSSTATTNSTATTASTSTTNTPSSSNTTAVPASPTQHKVSTKSLSFRKLFTDLKSSENERKPWTQSPDGGTSDAAVPDTTNNNNSKLSPDEIAALDALEQQTPSSAMSGSLKSSGSYFYKTVKKAMTSLEKKGKTISKKVKKSKKNKRGDDENDVENHKEKKPKKSKKKKSEDNSSKKKSVLHLSFQQPTLENSQTSNASMDMELPEDYKPSLDYDFGSNSSDSYDSSEYEDEDEDDTNTDLQSITSSENNLKKSQIINNGVVMAHPVPAKHDSSAKTTTIVISEPGFNNTHSDMLSTPRDESSNPSNPSPSLSAVIANDKDQIGRSPSEQSLVDAASFNLHMKQKKLLDPVIEHPTTTNTSFSTPTTTPSSPKISGANSPDGGSQKVSPRPSGGSFKRPAFTKQLSTNSMGSHGYSSLSSERLRPVLSRAPIPSSFVNNHDLTKSPSNVSIKHLVTFFEEKSTISDTKSVNLLQRQKSFRSDASAEK
ncbi:hypothetical protein CYY_000374 [Polysphondylium violaceum]|uniref:ELMO domain-containing protein n=1 Tax=Polysphondylium violaceum TaxID=133409 RepID=A0A8J4Q4R2_9MYCE|nr:hypothetical protein CYY_000374 [Polysphondylium violaceum]